MSTIGNWLLIGAFPGRRPLRALVQMSELCFTELQTSHLGAVGHLERV